MGNVMQHRHGEHIVTQARPEINKTNTVQRQHLQNRRKA